MNPLPRPYHGGFLRWFRTCLDAWGAHGSELVDRNIEHVAGRYSTGPSDADDDLRKAEALGWLRRGRLSPTVSQRAFLGLAYTVIPPIHASCWYWEPAERDTPPWAEAMAWLKEREALVLKIHRCTTTTCHVVVARPDTPCTHHAEAP